jgi:Fur family ferric uptake transcriptional regulator
MLPSVQVSQTPEQKFQEYLSTRPKPQRFTGQQKDMVRFIFSSHEHFDADSLLDEMRKAGLTISRATAYRTLTKLVDAGLLRRLVTGTRTFFEHDYGYPQHDHLRCSVCSKMIEFENPELETKLREVALAHGFQMDGHSLIVQGTCAECKRAKNARRKLDRI